MKFRYIAIEREYASGGSEIGSKVSDILKIPCYGREILEITAKRKNVSVEYIEELEENTAGSFLYNLYRMSDVTGSPSASESVNSEEINVIRELAGNGPAVFVGRAASFALSEFENVLKVFVYADTKAREKRANEVYNVEPGNISAILKKFDKRRESYYKANFGREWKDFDSYDIVLNSSSLGIDKCATAIAECAK